jgi:hypothetical protein
LGLRTLSLLMGEKSEPTGTSALPGGGRPRASPVTRIKTVLLLRLKYLAPSTAHNHQLLLISRLNVRNQVALAPPTADL